MKGFSGVGGFLRYKFEKNYEEQAGGFAGFSVGGGASRAAAIGGIAEEVDEEEFDADEDFI